VYADESGINSDLKREYGRARRGTRVENAKRGRKFHRVNIAAAAAHGKEGTKKLAPECYSGSMNGARFEKWFEDRLLSGVPEGCPVIRDRASLHRKKQLEELSAKAEVNLLFLPAYSPDFNPIEKDWANMKRALRDTAPLCDLLQTAIYNYWR
jgi:transposase